MNTSVIPTHRGLREETVSSRLAWNMYRFKASLDYLVRHCLKQKTNKITAKNKRRKTTKAHDKPECQNTVLKLF
jgi:hypothetical protein